MKFTEMGLADYIVKGLSDQGIETATEIQSLVMPVIKTGVDVIGLSQTGSGKTYAYGIPALERVDAELSATQFLVVCPTRELAVQIADDLRKLTMLTSNISVAPIFGGSHMDRQVQALKRGAKIVVGTPGRLMDHLRRKTLKLDKLKMVILDEADEMLNMGFKDDIETILKATPNTRQTLMFSATMPKEIINLTKQYMKDATIIKTENQESSHAMIKQYLCNCNKNDKTDVLCRIYEKFNPWISIVFCNTKRMTEELSESLTKRGLPAVCLNGDMRQNERKRVMDNFKKSGNGGILVATDVAARGIDIKNVDIVINYDFPNNEDYYVHRIGRTGRAGKEGIAFNIITTRQQEFDLYDLTRRLDGTIQEYTELSTTGWATKNDAKSKGNFNKTPMQKGFSRQGGKRDFTRARNDFKDKNIKPDAFKGGNRQRNDDFRGNAGRNNADAPRGSRGFADGKSRRNNSFDDGRKNDYYRNANRDTNQKQYSNRNDVQVFEIGGGSRQFSRPIGKNTVPGHYGKPDFRERRTSNRDRAGRSGYDNDRQSSTGARSRFDNNKKPFETGERQPSFERQSFKGGRQGPRTKNPRSARSGGNVQSNQNRGGGSFNRNTQRKSSTRQGKRF